MMDLQKPATWDDESLDMVMGSVLVTALRVSNEDWVAQVEAERTRRAEIRLERGEFGGSHVAAWYEARVLCTGIVSPDGDRCGNTAIMVDTDDEQARCIDCLDHVPSAVVDRRIFNTRKAI